MAYVVDLFLHNKLLNLSYQIRNTAEKVLGFKDVALRKDGYVDLRGEKRLILTGLVQLRDGSWLLRYTHSADDPYFGEVMLVDKEGKNVMQFKVSREHGVLDMSGFEYNTAKPYAGLPVYTELSPGQAQLLNLSYQIRNTAEKVLVSWSYRLRA